MRTIQHPGVEINEVDISQVAPAIAGTKTLIMGYADRGEENTPYEFTSRNSFLNYYGEPTNEAEYYFYDAANEILQQQGGLIAARIPYSNDVTDKFYSVSGLVPFGGDTNWTASSPLTALRVDGLSGTHDIKLNEKANLLEIATVDGYRTGSVTPSANHFVVINKSRDTLKKNSRDQEVNGLFVAFISPYNALATQGLFKKTESEPYADFVVLEGLSNRDGGLINNVTSGVHFNTALSATFDKSSVSKDFASLFPPIRFDDDGKFDNYHIHQVMLVVAKTFEDVQNAGKTNVEILETFMGSFNKASIDESTGESIFIQDIVNTNSNYIELYTNITGTALAGGGYVYNAMGSSSTNQKPPLLSFAEAQTTKSLSAPTIFKGIDTVLNKTNNIDETVIDVVADAGLTSIVNMINASNKYTPTSGRASDTITSRSDVANWRTVANKLIKFCKDDRKDCLALIDGPRQLCLQGDEKIERETAPTQLIDTFVLPKLKYITGLNTNYAALNIMWLRAVNEFSGKQIWLPPSNRVAGVITFTDRVANYWDAPAGLNRGRLFGITDIAFNPNKGQMNAIYSKGFNYARNFPLDGVVLEGQKTLQNRPSAFDRINVRRTFLRLERLTLQVLRFFVYEPNNFFTRTQIVDILTPVFENVKVNGGLFDYRIICSEKNNTPEVVDRNELKIAIMLKPTRTAEFILADFFALRTGASFNEVIL